MKRKALGAVVILLVGSCLSAGADGAGGVLLGYYAGSHPLALRYQIPSNGGDLMYFGGFGYGVERHGVLNGGFGIALLDTNAASGVAGGMGGFITGLRLLRVPLHVAVVSWTGVGGVFAGKTGPYAGRGYFIGLEEVDLEVGLPLSAWFMPTVFVGYQVTGNLVPGLPLRERVTYAPVAGFRISWARFR